jgi:hypothetical protein
MSATIIIRPWGGCTTTSLFRDGGRDHGDKALFARALIGRRPRARADTRETSTSTASLAARERSVKRTRAALTHGFQLAADWA